MCAPKFNKIITSNFHPLEVASRGSDTQLQVGENCICLIDLFKG